MRFLILIGVIWAAIGCGTQTPPPAAAPAQDAKLPAAAGGQQFSQPGGK